MLAVSYAAIELIVFSVLPRVSAQIRLLMLRALEEWVGSRGSGFINAIRQQEYSRRCWLFFHQSKRRSGCSCLVARGTGGQPRQRPH